MEPATTEGAFRLSATDFQSNEVPHYFLTSGRKWLVCIDGSSESKLGLFHALDLMNPSEDNLILVHSAKKSRRRGSRLWGKTTEPTAPTTPATTAEAVTPTELEPEPDSVKRGKGYLAHAGNLVRQWGEEVKWSSRFIEAKDPREAICDLATEEKVDYIVMGSRGQNPIKQLFMGSVSSYVSAHAPCPVIVIRESEEQKREKKAASKTATEKTEKKKKVSKKDKGLVQQPVQEMMKRPEDLLPQPAIVPPVGIQGPIVPGEMTIPVMEK